MFGNKILNYWNDIVRDLAVAVSIPSVCQEPEGIYPYGKETAKVLDTVLDMARSYGLETKNVNYYAGHAEYGEGEENAVVMAHLDVVPPGDGWLASPYTLVQMEGCFYGRGVADNKGHAIVALHCLRALKDAGVPARRKLRVVFGCGEEIGMDDMKHYFASEQHPTMGFTPDGRYGVCHCEKGLLRFDVRGNASPVVRSFVSGTVVNAVPYKAKASLICSKEEYEQFISAAKKAKGRFDCRKTVEGLSVTSYGTASHAASPERGFNAAAYLIDLIVSVFGSRAGTLFCFLRDAVGTAYDGSLYGVACEDEPSGPLTLNLGIVQADETEAHFSVDIRYPATKDGSRIAETLRQKTQDAGLIFDLISDEPPLYLPKDGPLVKLLSGAYEDITGQPCSIYSMGGGTYARQMFGRGVAFGANFEGYKSDAHNCNEHIRVENLKLHAQICLEAMYRMLTAE